MGRRGHLAGFVAWAVTIVLAVGGCATSGQGAGSSPTTPATSDSIGSTGGASPAGTPSTVPETLRFTSPTVGGGTFDGASLAGKPAVLWFWAAWCPRCRAKAADVKAMQATFAGRVNTVGVAGLGSGNEGMQRFVAQYGLSGFPHLADDQGVVWKHFQVVEQEIFVLIDAAGKVVHKGPLSSAELNERVGALAG